MTGSFSVASGNQVAGDITKHIVDLYNEAVESKDEAKSLAAFNYFKELSDRDVPQALVGLGWCYQYGVGVSKSPEEGVNFIRRAAEMQSTMGQYALGRAYKYGIGVPQSDTYASEWYKRAADQGDPDGMASMVRLHEKGEGLPQSEADIVRYLHLLAESGNRGFQYELGSRYENGTGVPKSISTAIKWYRASAEQGYDLAQCSLGFCYAEGEGVDQSYIEANKWFRRAAELENPSAQVYLGLAYTQGHGVEQSWTEAVKWYRKAADSGYAIGQYSLGLCYEDGHGVQQSREEAMKWYRLAADQGDKKAKEGLLRLESNKRDVVLPTYAYKREEDDEGITFTQKCAGMNPGSIAIAFLVVLVIGLFWGIPSDSDESYSFLPVILLLAAMYGIIRFMNKRLKGRVHSVKILKDGRGLSVSGRVFERDHIKETALIVPTEPSGINVNSCVITMVYGSRRLMLYQNVNLNAAQPLYQDFADTYKRYAPK